MIANAMQALRHQILQTPASPIQEFNLDLAGCNSSPSKVFVEDTGLTGQLTAEDMAAF